MGIPVLKISKMSMVLLYLLLGIVLVARGELPDFPMTFREMEVHAGYYTAKGKYLGGIPKADKLSREIYECKDYHIAENGTGNATTCLQWRADESAGGSFQVGSCECRFMAPGDAYCTTWVCVQVERGTYCDDTCYVESNTDSVICDCDVENDSGLHCDTWSCKQIDSKGRVEYESYQCVRTSASGHYCEAWNGNVTASDEIEVVACECKYEWQGPQVCSYWECEELGLSTCTSSKRSWCDLGVSVGVGGGFGLIGVAFLCVCICSLAVDDVELSDNLKCTGGISAILWCCSWASGVVIWGGADGATYVGIMWGVPISVAFIVVAYGLHYKRYKTPLETRSEGIASRNGHRQPPIQPARVANKHVTRHQKSLARNNNN